MKYIKIVFFFIFLKLFLKLTYQNDLKTPKKILIYNFINQNQVNRTEDITPHILRSKFYG
jgi:hypothetical protein